MSDKAFFSILVIDDSQSFADSLMAQLNKLGFNRATHAANAREAIETLNSQSFDIVFIDVVMPDTNGIELTATIRSAHKTIKIINMSSLAQEKVIIDSITAGADDFIQKPIPEHILESIMNKMMYSKKE